MDEDLRLWELEEGEFTWKEGSLLEDKDHIIHRSSSLLYCWESGRKPPEQCCLPLRIMIGTPAVGGLHKLPRFMTSFYFFSLI